MISYVVHVITKRQRENEVITLLLMALSQPIKDTVVGAKIVVMQMLSTSTGDEKNARRRLVAYVQHASSILASSTDDFRIASRARG